MTARLQIRTLGPLEIRRDGVALALPASRKVRALAAYLALAPQAPTRSHLCDLLWDLPDDPRGELRWCLSKLRGVLDEGERTRVLARGDAIALDLEGSEVDALQLAAALRQGVAGLELAALRELSALFRGDFLDGLEIPRSAAYSAWLTAERRRHRAAQTALLERLAGALPPGSDEALACIEAWLRLAPFDGRAHERLFETLAAAGRLREGEEHLAQLARQYEAEGQDWAPLGHAWRAARLRQGPQAARLVVDAAPAIETAAPTRRASLAVMPFADRGRAVAARGGLGDGLAHDIISRLAMLRSLFVIAPGTVFALDERHIGAEDAARRLDVDYVAAGSLRREAGGRLSVAVQLSETRSARVLWAEVFSGGGNETLGLLEQIGNRIVSALAQQIEMAERNRAILKPPSSLDAWEAHHRGLWHMMRFNREDNEQARHFFATALRLDPGFARPYAGLSFTHFQDAFLGWSPREAAVEAAYRIASQGLLADERDPAVHWALGRSQWLAGRLPAALEALQRSVELSPNFAHGHYTLAFVHAQSGDAGAAIVEADHSRALSPFDPMLFAMLATRAIALMRLGAHDEAADWGLKAAARPNAHVHILCVALHCLMLAGRESEAAPLAQAIQRAQPGYRIDDFLAAFRCAPDGEALLRRAAARLEQRNWFGY
ncbi:transcriptional regulator [Roseateles violae]|uniref:Transcriptional regulator n=1 Tax=Roseateles violae TaxID=3058042 RepID=A0ABT8DX97_9BURK|nr:transcriptional regulator [Pelomonas sp. PFR6]MDN3921269.1 transcriptional regulator [Pelomonas sp. PFR6]